MICFLQTPLHLAAKGGFPGCIQILLDHGASMYAINGLRETPESMIDKIKQPRCTKVFEHAKAKYEIPGRTRVEQKLVDGKFVS